MAAGVDRAADKAKADKVRIVVAVDKMARPPATNSP